MAGYLSHFGLKMAPFSTSPDPRFAYATKEHEIAATKIQYAVEERQGLFLLMGDIGTGKCLGRGTPVLMFDGTVKPVEDVQVGDRLMEPDFSPRRVLSLAQGEEMLYRVVPTKGEPYVVNESHILSLKMTCLPNKRGLRFGERPLSRQVVNVSVRDYLQKPPTFRSNAKGWRVGVDFPEQAVPLHPYFLGLWLGDGSSRAAAINTTDVPVVDFLQEYAACLGLKLVRVHVKGDRCPRFALSGDRRQRSGRITPGAADAVRELYAGRGHTQAEVGEIFGLSQASVSEIVRGKTWQADPQACATGNVVLQALQRLDLIGHKHVPHAYLANSREVRRLLLAGLIDSDGHLTCNGYDLVFQQEGLARDAAFLARSLGLAASMTPCRKTCTTTGTTGLYWRISISGDTDQIPVRIPRKKAAPRQQKKDVLLTGIRVEEAGWGEYFGFEIDGDGLFLLGDFTVTHNTTLSQFMMSQWRADDTIIAGHITDPSPETPAPFLRLILAAFGRPAYYRIEDNKLALREFLVENFQAGRTCIVMIDEAQSISPKNMDTLQMLSNEQTTTAKLLQIVLLSLPNFTRKLTYKPALRSRIASGATLDPLTFDDAVEMLRYRVEVAGGDFDTLIPVPLHRAIYNATQGNPRNLCVLCDNILVNAYARRKKAADSDSLAAALADLNFKGWAAK